MQLMIIDPNSRLFHLGITLVIAILTLTGCTKDHATVPTVDNTKSTHYATVNVFVGTDPKAIDIEPAGEIWDIVSDTKENSIITLCTRNDQWVIQVFRNGEPSAKELTFDQGWLPGSRVFFYKGQPCITAGRKGDLQPALFVIGSALKQDPTFNQGQDTDIAISRNKAKSRRDLLAKLKVDRPLLGQEVGDNRHHGSLTNEAFSWSTFPILIGHPMLPIVSFSSNDQILAVLDENVAIFNKSGQRWTRLIFKGRRDNEWPSNGDKPISADLSSEHALLGFKHQSPKGRMSYETRMLVLNAKTWTTQKPIAGLIATPRNQREY